MPYNPLQIKPMKTKSSRRYYRPDDVAILELIKELLYVRRYTIEGVQKLFKNRTVKDILGTEIQKDFFEDIDDNTDTNTEVSNTAMQDAINSAIISLSQIKEDLKNIVSL